MGGVGERYTPLFESVGERGTQGYGDWDVLEAKGPGGTPVRALLFQS